MLTPPGHEARLAAIAGRVAREEPATEGRAARGRTHCFGCGAAAPASGMGLAKVGWHSRPLRSDLVAGSNALETVCPACFEAHGWDW